jgi:hypothetical protein
MAEITTAWTLGCVCGFFMGVTVAGRRRPTCRELMRDPDPDWRRSFRSRRSEPSCGSGEITLAKWEAMRTPFAEGRTIRGNGNGGPTTPKPDITPKPQFPPPQIIREDFLQ